MAIHYPRFLIAILATYFAYAAVYISGISVLGLDPVMVEYSRPFDDPLSLYGVGGNFVMSVMIVALHFFWVRAESWKTGAAFGLVLAIYYSASQVSTMGGFKDFPPRLVFDFLPLHLLAGIVAGGVVPGLVYKAPAARSASDA